MTDLSTAEQKESEMPDLRQVLSDLEAIWAYDQGSTDSGVHDERLRARRIAELREANPWENAEARRVLSEWVSEQYLSAEALAAGYGWEDALGFLKRIDGDL